MEDFLKQEGRRLEDQFFAQQDALLIAKERELQKMAHTQQALAAVSGITDAAVLKKLVELEVHADLLATLVVVPLVEVAWADGGVHEKERGAILQSAAGGGWAHGSVDDVLLEEWLKQKPPPRLMEAWLHFIGGLCQVLPPAEREALRKSLLSRARAVAEASGGFLGLTSGISRAEQAVLDRMAAAFGGEE